MRLIVLHSTKYSESSLILHAYTQEGGRESFFIRGAYGSKGKRGNASSIHPLSILDYEVLKSNKGSLKVIKEYTPAIKLEEIRCKLEKSSISMFICELLYRSLRESTPDKYLYGFLEESIITLNNIPKDCKNFHLWFIIRLCGIMGFSPTGDFILDFNPFNPKQIELIKYLNTSSYINLINPDRIDTSLEATKNLSGAQRKEFLESIIKYLEYHLGIKLNIFSLDILHSIFKG